MRRQGGNVIHALQSTLEELPSDYPNHNSVYHHDAKWRDDGTWQALNEALRQQERQRQERHLAPSAVVLDSQSVKTTEVGGERGYDAGKKVNGRKRHIVVDTAGQKKPDFCSELAPGPCRHLPPTSVEWMRAQNRADFFRRQAGRHDF